MLNKKALSATAAAQALYVEDVFSTYLYTGNGSTQTITNNIDLSGEGGMVWIKGRSTTGQRNGFFDTLRGASNFIWSDSTAGNNVFSGYGVTNFGSSSFSLGDDSTGGYWVNGNNITYASWTFRKAEKFFDVVTYTGNGSNRTIAHNLGSVPGCIIIKRTDTTGAWQVYHRSLANTEYLVLNTTAAKATGTTRWNSTTPTSTVFSLGTDATVNANGGSYVAYLFAHDAGGFGDSGSDNVITCGSYTGNGSTTGPSVTLGYEPQWVLIKNVSNANDWVLVDNLRKFLNTSSGDDIALLRPNLSDAEVGTRGVSPTSTGFSITSAFGNVNTNGSTYIYIAIRRGPMKTPTLGTDVFYPTTYTGPALNIESTVTTGWPVDSIWAGAKNYFGSYKTLVQDRLRTKSGTTDSNSLVTAATDDEAIANTYATFKLDSNTGYKLTDSNGSWNGDSSGGYNPYAWVFRRAPKFFDTVCYTGTGSARTVTHNLGAVPEFIIVKTRNASGYDWMCYHTGLNGGTTPQNWWIKLNGNFENFDTGIPWNDTAPTSSVFSLGADLNTNRNDGTLVGKYVAYLFATLSGVSKVGSYTGTGTTLQINCGFTSGARFVLIKRTDSTGDWYVWDTARGIVSGNDPYLLMNSDAVEVTNTDYIDTYSSGFEISSTAPAAINANGGKFIYLAIA